MAGLLDNGYTPDPLAMGLLGMGSALMTPRAMGGGVGAGMNAFAQQAMAAQQMRRAMAQDEMQRKLFDLRLGEAAETAEERKRKREQEAALQRAASDAYTPASPGSLGGGVTPGSEQGRMLLGQMSGDSGFDAAMLQSTNSALNSVGPQQAVSAPTPGGFDRRQFIANLYGAGMPGEAMKIEDSLAKDSPFGKVDPKDFTPESIARFSASRNYADLMPARRREFVNGTAVDSYNVAPGTQIPQQMPFEYEPDPQNPGRVRMRPEVLGAKTQVARAGASTVNTAFPRQMAGVDAKISEGDMAKWEAARAARGALRSLMQASSGAASGPMANAVVTGIDFLASIGVASENLRNVSADTAQFNAQATELVLANIKKLGANPSNADLNEIKRLVPQATTSRDARERVAQIMLKYTNRAEFDAKQRFNYIQQNQSSAGWNPVKINEMPKDQRQLLPGATYQHPVTQEIAVYRGNGQFETIAGDD